MNIYIYVYKGNYSPSPQFICPMWHGKFTWSFHLELGFHKYIHMNIYICLETARYKPMSGDIFVWNWPGPHAFEPDVQYVHFLGPFSLRCRWLVLSEAWGYGRSGNQVPPPALAVTCLESSATVASARCIVRSLGSVYSTGTGHKAQGIIYRLFFLSISQYIIIYI